MERLLELLQPGGALSQALPQFELRSGQAEMLLTTAEAFQKNKIALIEAGTGTGKSLAYLLPAISFALEKKERIVISTQTIALQEQLIHKDIPLAAKALKLPFKAVLVKGMSNYVCPRKLKDLRESSLLFSEKEKKELDTLEAWSSTCKEGTRSSLPFIPSRELWEQVAAESDACSGSKCPHYDDCPFFKARKQSHDAQVLVVNHHLLFSDLSIREETHNFEETALLPSYARVILDEAHHIETIAIEHFASKISQFYLLKLLGRLFAEKGSLGKLQLLKQRLQNCSVSGIIPLISRLTLDIPAQRRDVQLHLFEAFEALSQFTAMVNGEEKLRLLPEHFTHPFWKEEVLPKGEALFLTLKKFTTSIVHLEKEIRELEGPPLIESTKSLRLDLLALTGRIDLQMTAFEDFLKGALSHERVLWIEHQKMGTSNHVQLTDARLDIDEKLAKTLFSKMLTTVLCSATLTTHDQFSFIREQLGLNKGHIFKKPIIEKIFPSPFNFSKQALFLVPKDLPNPTSPAFLKEARECILQAIDASQGNAFVLFTSYRMLSEMYESLAPELSSRYCLMKQGDATRRALIQHFRSQERSVLFGTDSFWEGVDVAGDALRLVILVKLPFAVPSDPLTQAKSEQLVSQGKNPFFDYALPQAICKFKQGFGRLIRHHQDRGCVVCLDPRLAQKPYGKLFLKTLPECKKEIIEKSSLGPIMKAFYQKNRSLFVKKKEKTS